MHTKVGLIFPGNAVTQGVTSNGCFPPLGLLSIATFLTQSHADVEMTIVDEEAGGDGNAAAMEADLVGIYANLLTYARAIAIAEVAKSNGARVVLGGPYPSRRSRQILRAQQSIDAVVVGDGEGPMAMLAAGAGFPTVPNLVYRDGEHIVQNRCVSAIPDAHSPVNFDLVDLSPYWTNWYTTFPEKRQYARPLPIMIQRGCGYSVHHGPCVFCSDPHQERGRIRPSELWRYVTELRDRFSADYIRDNADDPFRDEAYVVELCRCRPSTALPAMRVYCRADTITPKLIRQMHLLNVVDVFIGFESGDDEVLKNSNKGSTRSVHLRAARLLADGGIGLIASFILGLPGETLQSVRKTVDHIHEIRSTSLLERPGCAIMIPFPGSPSFAMMMKDARYRQKYANVDLLDYEELRRDWVRSFTSVDYDELVAISDSLFADGVIGSRMGNTHN